MEIDKTVGAISWMDLTVPNAEAVRDFYQQVVGWQKQDIPMGGYDDYCVLSPSDGTVRAGICHAQGVNASLPPFWLMYINVANLDESVAAVEKGGGKIIGEIRAMGDSRFCIIQDPAGAYCGLFQH